MIDKKKMQILKLGAMMYNRAGFLEIDVISLLIFNKNYAFREEKTKTE